MPSPNPRLPGGRSQGVAPSFPQPTCSWRGTWPPSLLWGARGTWTRWRLGVEVMGMWGEGWGCSQHTWDLRPGALCLGLLLAFPLCQSLVLSSSSSSSSSLLPPPGPTSTPCSQPGLCFPEPPLEWQAVWQLLPGLPRALAGKDRETEQESAVHGEARQPLLVLPGHTAQGVQGGGGEGGAAASPDRSQVSAGHEGGWDGCQAAGRWLGHDRACLSCHLWQSVGSCCREVAEQTRWARSCSGSPSPWPVGSVFGTRPRLLAAQEPTVSTAGRAGAEA